MGHALDNTLQDILIRFKRMQGYNVLWMPGTDHAGIATQIKVEEMLAKEEGKSRYDLGREKFVERVWEWKKEYGDTIVKQIRSLGASCDWTRERFTLDEGYYHAVREVFVSLYEKGLIYRGERIINWCPRCATALSDVEVEHEDEHGHLWHIKYPVKGEDLILAEPTEESTADVRSFLYQNYSAYAEIQSTENFLRLSAASSTRTHQAYLLFYIMSTLVLFGALLLNTYRILRRRIPEYAVHHLFGATQRFIFARMYLFVLGYHVIPLAGTLLILSLNRLASPLNLLMVFAATMGSAFLVTSIVQQRFVSKFSQGLRRE